MVGKAQWATLILVLPLVLAGCGSSARIPINAAQRLVMEPALLSAGVTAVAPQLVTRGLLRQAEAQVSYGDGEGGEALTLHYRFYWYDRQGLELSPPAPPRSLTLRAGERVTLTSFSRDPQARQVRLYLYR
ncbi:hypothetical protein A9798_08885 [Edwardsiella hoshinae]|uniref:Predicted periplasmic lipoprotein n=1 Tax=Edwardsiella hoshinae TaxID=93378 RepID=A0A376DFI8_9GAMM|nr:DUF1425 domain-containing protein [Edwardsiella hoshinae]AOV97072.1 hypothetical protein A9798_08885 [Edwardsiella hoshinae]QPR27077.1 DUF1425 domain-containing protein [Edwardsiella hoshinae]STC88541.1 Predicted periplasmic lipoprotein [Edwardsiella hoshinae]